MKLTDNEQRQIEEAVEEVGLDYDAIRDSYTGRGESKVMLRDQVRASRSGSRILRRTRHHQRRSRTGVGLFLPTRQPREGHDHLLPRLPTERGVVK